MDSQLDLQQLISTSEDEFIQDEASSRKLCLSIFAELKNAVILNNLDSLKALNKLILIINSASNKAQLQTCYNRDDNILKHTNLIILACKYDKLNSLQYLFDNYNLLNIINCAITPYDQDGECHNAFYYAIRESSIKILKLLIDEWPGINSDELDEVVSQAYEELKLKNVALSNEMEVFVEDTLINLRFYSDDSSPAKNVTVGNIQERIDFVLENINLLNSEYLQVEIDDKFLYVVKLIAKNVHILKRYLRSTYDRLPWEEIEFCLVSFVKSYTTQEEIHLLYKTVLSAGKLLSHLCNFAIILKEVKIDDVTKLRTLPNISRDDNIKTIIQNYPKFEELYDHYAEIIDVYSLSQIKYYTDMVSFADFSQEEEKLIIARALQVMGEYTKNSLESPKLSSTTSELLLQSLQNDTRTIVKDLRNSLSHSNSIYKMIQIEDNTDISFFTNIQEDIKRINNVITGILYNLKLKRIRTLLKTIISSSSSYEIRGTLEAFYFIDFKEYILVTKTSENYSVLKQLIETLSKKICSKTNLLSEEIADFDKIERIIEAEEVKLKDIRKKYIKGLSFLKHKSEHLNRYNISKDEIALTKFFAKEALEYISPTIGSQNFKDIAKILTFISYSVMSRIKQNSDDLLTCKTVTSRTDKDELLLLFHDVIYAVEFDMEKIKWVEELRDKLKECGNNSRYNHAQKEETKISHNKFDELLSKRLSLLEIVLKKYSERLKCVKIQAILEMALLDIMSILGTFKKCLNYNFLYLDSNFPLLTGTNLRNYLAHGNTLIDILSLNRTTAVLSNVSRLTKDNIIQINRKLGKILEYDFLKLRKLHDQNLKTIINQTKMFKAIEEGNFEETKICIQNGADIKARTNNLCTALHLAAKQSNIVIVKFLLDQNLNVGAKNLERQSAVDVAALYGNKDFIEVYVQKHKLLVENTDFNGNTLLHLAAQNGQKEIIELLYKNNASTTRKNISGYSPLHYAILYGHIDAAKFLVSKEKNVDINQTLGGYTSLHLATEKGHVDIVNFLLEKNANVNAKNDSGCIPLHITALNGHFDVANNLILKGSQVNTRNEDGCTPLHYAVEKNHENVVQLLIKHGADVNIRDKLYLNTPLCYAAGFGYKEITKILLENKANINIKTIEHMTPLALAASKGHLDIVLLLLNSKADIVIEDTFGHNALHLSAYNGYIEIVETLLNKGSNINAVDKYKHTSLHLAAARGHNEVIKLLLLKGAKINSGEVNGFTALHLSSANGQGDTTKMLIENGADININNEFNFTPLEEAIKSDSSNTAEILIDAGANFNSALNIAAFFGSKNVVQMLLNKNIDSKTEDNIETLLHVATENSQIEVAKILIEKSNDIGAISLENCTLLCSSVRNNLIEIVDILLAKGADVNGKEGRPLQTAIIFGHTVIIKTLLAHTKINLNLTMKFNWTFLHTAARLGDKRTAEVLLKRGVCVDPVTTEFDNVTPLLIASYENHKEVVELLLTYKASANIRSKCGETPLYRAVGKGNADIVELLLKAGANSNIRNDKNVSPVELAVDRGHFAIVKMLLKYTDVNKSGNLDWTMLHIAAKGDHLEIAKYLIENGANVNARNYKHSKPIHIAAINGARKVMEYLFDNSKSLNEYGAAFQNLLHYAAIGGHSKTFKYLIDKKFDVNSPDINGRTALHLAALEGHKNIVQILLNNGANYKIIDRWSKKPVELSQDGEVIKLLTTTENLCAAVKNEDISEIKRNIKEGAVVNCKNIDGPDEVRMLQCLDTDINAAAANGSDIRMIESLIINGIDVNTTDSEGRTPLHFATSNNHIDVVLLLLQHGANVTCCTNKGNTPLHTAVSKGNKEIIKVLLNHVRQNHKGRLVNFLDAKTKREGSTVLHVAAKNNFEDIVNILLEYGAAYNLTDNNNKNPCDLIGTGGNLTNLFKLLNSSFEAAKSGNHNLVNKINKNNCDYFISIMNARNKEGKTLLQVALINKHKELASKLVQILKSSTEI